MHPNSTFLECWKYRGKFDSSCFKFFAFVILLFRDPITPALAVGGALTLGGALWSSTSAPR